MSDQNIGEVHVKSLTDVCQNVCTFIKSITKDNSLKNDKLQTLVMKIDDLQIRYQDLNIQLEGIHKHVKTLANLLSFTINQDDSTVTILENWIQSLSKKNNGNAKKRKLLLSYSPLKLSLRDSTEVNNGETENKTNCSKLEKENKLSPHNKFKNVWKLQVKVDGKPTDLLKKSKQTTLNLLPQKDKLDLDITALNGSTQKTSVLNSSSVFNLEEFSEIKKNIDDNNLIQESEMNDSCNISLSYFNKDIKSHKNIIPREKTKTLETDIPRTQIENYNESNDDIIYSPINNSKNVLQNSTITKIQSKVNDNSLLNKFDIIPGINDKKNDLPNYNFKEDPVRKRNERKFLNGWDCAECCRFYEANNDNPVEAKNAMNHFSRHRSIKHQLHAPTPPGFWDPI